MRSSVEELRKPSQKQDDLRTLWLIYGQDAIVLIENGYKGSNEIGYFIDNPASNLEKDYQSIEPK